MSSVIVLRAPNVNLVVDVATGVPTIVHWGAPIGDADPASVAAALGRPRMGGTLDTTAPMSLVPEHGAGFPGRPGLLGRRGGGRAWAPRFEPASVAHTGGELVAVAADAVAQLTLTSTLRLTTHGVLHASVAVTNTGSRRYSLDALTVSLPLPEAADELLTFTGRWVRELHPERLPWRHGAHSAENRTGRSSHEHPPLVHAGTTGFGEWHGEVWGVHLAWSGNHSWLAERLPDGRRYLQLGELLHPGEVVLEPGDTYTTPEVLGVYSSQGLTPASWGLHRDLRARPGHPTRPRPVLLNTWEAVYFDHDVDRLKALADSAASVGIERFVLDDGWFGARRDDTRGLGDWTVSPERYPEGLAPLIDHVRGRGMEFGIWVEPEMVNPDSDLYRAHPEWALVTPGYEPVLGRNQLVLNLAHPAAYAHILGQLDALLRDHDIAYVKWDMNRVHAQDSGADGAPGAHAQTLAVYRLLDELGRRHPDVEIESCSSGGGRIDHGILTRTARVWTSDCNDALERQTIQRGASMLIPPEVMGAHIGPTRSHTTGRVHTLAFRAATALFGHLGVEWNVLELSEQERADLAEAVALHQRFRPLLHGGDTVRFDVESPGVAHGVYAPDRSEGVVSYALLGSAMSLTLPTLRLPGLDPARRYRILPLPLPGPGGRIAERQQPPWWRDGLTLTGAQLAAHGVRLPALLPEQAALLHLDGR